MNNDHLNSKSLFLIEYPGVVKNVDRMLETLGSLNNLEKVISNPQLRLQLKFRPNDPFSHCAIADKLQLNNLLAKTVKKKIHFSDGTSEIKYETVIVGLIESTFRFQTLSDFQYLPIERINFNANKILDQIVEYGKSNISNLQLDENEQMNHDQSNQPNNSENVEMDNDKRANNQKLQNYSSELLNNLDQSNQPIYKSIFKQVYPFNALDGNVKKFDENVPLFMMPIIFSRFDSPSDYLYKNDPKSRQQENSTSPNNREGFETEIRLNRKSRAKFVYLVTFQEEPPKVRFEQKEDYILDKNFLNQIKQKFEEQPIWSKTELAFRLNCKRKDLKYLLPIVAFYYTNGPFRGQWVRFGFNPKENKISRFNQTLDLRTACLINKQKSCSKEPRKTAIVYNTIKSISETKKKDVKIAHDKLHLNKGGQPNLTSTNRGYMNQIVNESDFKFLAGQIPKNKQIFYQIKNIELNEVKEIINEECTLKDVCDEKDGWWPSGLIDKIRSLMINHVNELLLMEDNNFPINSLTINEEKEYEDKELDDVEKEIQEYYSIS